MLMPLLRRQASPACCGGGSSLLPVAAAARIAASWPWSWTYISSGVTRSMSCTQTHKNIFYRPSLITITAIDYHGQSTEHNPSLHWIVSLTEISSTLTSKHSVEVGRASTASRSASCLSRELPPPGPAP